MSSGNPGIAGPLNSNMIIGDTPKSIVGTTGLLYSTMLRVKSLEKSDGFYGKLLGMKKVKEHIPKTWGEGKRTDEGEERVKKAWYGWGSEGSGALIELWETEGDNREKYCNGNESEGKGFGHTGIIVGDLYEVCGRLEKEGVNIRRKPGPFQNVGDIAFAEDPDGYWMELIQKSGKRKDGSPKGVVGVNPVMAQTMIRVKDPLKTIRFFQKLGMTLLTRLDFDSLTFSLFFLVYADGEETMLSKPELDDKQEKKAQWLWGFPRETLELTHNWGTETEKGPVYHSGNTEPLGFGYIAVACKDVAKVADLMEKDGYEVLSRCTSGSVKDRTAVIKEPTGYWVKLVERAD